MGNTKSIGIAYSDQDLIGSDTIYVNGVLGYSTVAQGAVTQATSKSTAVTLNKSAGVITMNNASLATATNATFTLNNSLISANDIIILTIAGGQTTPGSYNVFANALGAGTVSITLRNISGGSLSEAIVVNFAILHCQ
jgi:predicted ThiF/HesA family dinucleotide-utilizing enzyme